jgi:hypothetical protein
MTPQRQPMTITQFIASCLYAASWEIQRPEFFRHNRARLDLMRCLRGVG